jgi:menaquinone-specific isochorismate synthase
MIKANSGFSLECAVERLSSLYPECTVFAIDNGRTSLTGATPEVLARVEKGELNLSCLASSAPRGTSREEDTRFEQELLASPKERREHAAVLTMLTQTLSTSCSNLRYPKTPEVWKLKNVQHLLTPVSAELRSDRGILDIVKQLHPTPAVGGWPTEKALEFVREREGDRGWYAAPVGWADQYGNGEFGVAIRSALIDHEKAYLYAGAGIVQGSDPDLEYAETEVKFQPMLAALTGNNQ